ncbi:MAG: hypothetical protein JO318_07610 [Chloroflexi bacterium]|nr:hypothetical protein [Chloroflexota bacterium]MBV9132549.1 hypothetical protein [Chloroflexota bacterium]
MRLSCGDEADGRLRLILGVISVVFAATLGLIPRGTVSVATPSGTELVPITLPFWSGACAITALLFFGAAGIVALVGYWPKTMDRPPKPQGIEEYVSIDERQTKRDVLNAMLNAYSLNDRMLGTKMLLFRWALVVAATGLLGASVIIELLQVTHAYS